VVVEGACIYFMLSLKIFSVICDGDVLFNSDAVSLDGVFLRHVASLERS